MTGGDDIDRIAIWVLSDYRLPIGSLTALGNRGGFSGARLWQVHSAASRLCLRAWPASQAADRARFRHRLMDHARHEGLSFVPPVHRTKDGSTLVTAGGRLWELTGWMDGQADYAQQSTAARLTAAAEALAQLHRAWSTFTQRAAPCPAVRRRLDLLARWQTFVRGGWQFTPRDGHRSPIDDIAERAWNLLTRTVGEVPGLLERWLGVAVNVQPCLCDIWHDHLLFQQERLTGIVDYGAIKMDHVAVDLARMLGSLLGDDAKRWDQALRAYRQVRPFSAAEERLAHDLDRTGTILGMANWLLWIYEDRRDFEDWCAVAQRLEALVQRVERWKF